MKIIQNIKAYVCYIRLKMFDLSIKAHEAKMLFACARNMLLNPVCAEGHFQCAKDSS
jgi:hypothetical protein